MYLLETRSKYPSTKQPTAGTRKKCSVSSIRVLAKSCGFKLQNLQSVMENPPLPRLYPKKREKGSIVKRRKIWYNEKTWEAKEAMPSFDIHLAIARNYVKNHKEITNVQDFIKGSIAPDLVPDKRISHYTKEQDKNDLAKSLHNKVAIDEFLKRNEIKTDYDKGVYLHLLTDYLFYNEFFDEEYLKQEDGKNFRKDLYYSYIITNEYLKGKYDTSYGVFQEQIEQEIQHSQKSADYQREKRQNIIPFDALDQFIDKVSKTDLKSYHFFQI